MRYIISFMCDFGVRRSNWAENIVLKVTQIKKTFKLIVIKEVT